MPGFAKLLTSAAIVLIALSTANARPDARAMTCAEVQALLLRERAATLTTGPHTYGRFVAPGACDGTGLAQPASVPTKDTNKCAVHACGPRVPRTD